MIEAVNVLFMGGPIDGERMAVQKDMTYMDYPVFLDQLFNPTKRPDRIHYRFYPLQDADGQVYTVAMPLELGELPIRKLIEGYRESERCAKAAGRSREPEVKEGQGSRGS